ncbi:MAG: hypothetical protein KGJ62_15045 [Armatimonadetes bacterium]|nr:hypothetical protein [Armatimonadota bacterium]MDE2207695.1 hypothetical protein [Armatimonadota bacterium]
MKRVTVFLSTLYVVALAACAQGQIPHGWTRRTLADGSVVLTSPDQTAVITWQAIADQPTVSLLDQLRGAVNQMTAATPQIRAIDAPTETALGVTHWADIILALNSGGVQYERLVRIVQTGGHEFLMTAAAPQAEFGALIRAVKAGINPMAPLAAPAAIEAPATWRVTSIPNGLSAIAPDGRSGEDLILTESSGSILTDLHRRLIAERKHDGPLRAVQLQVSRDRHGAVAEFVVSRAGVPTRERVTVMAKGGRAEVRQAFAPVDRSLPRFTRDVDGVASSSPEPAPPMHRAVAADGSFSMDLPANWHVMRMSARQGIVVWGPAGDRVFQTTFQVPSTLQAANAALQSLSMDADGQLPPGAAELYHALVSPRLAPAAVIGTLYPHAAAGMIGHMKVLAVTPAGAADAQAIAFRHGAAAIVHYRYTLNPTTGSLLMRATLSPPLVQRAAVEMEGDALVITYPSTTAMLRAAGIGGMRSADAWTLSITGVEAPVAVFRRHLATYVAIAESTRMNMAVLKAIVGQQLAQSHAIGQAISGSLADMTRSQLRAASGLRVEPRAGAKRTLYELAAGSMWSSPGQMRFHDLPADWPAWPAPSSMVAASSAQFRKVIAGL